MPHPYMYVYKKFNICITSSEQTNISHIPLYWDSISLCHFLTPKQSLCYEQVSDCYIEVRIKRINKQKIKSISQDYNILYRKKLHHPIRGTGDNSESVIIRGPLHPPILKLPSKLLFSTPLRRISTFSYYINMHYLTLMSNVHLC